MPGNNSEREPPESISNSEVKPFSANDSVGNLMPKSDIARLQIKTLVGNYRNSSFVFDYLRGFFVSSISR